MFEFTLYYDSTVHKTIGRHTIPSLNFIDLRNSYTLPPIAAQASLPVLIGEYNGKICLVRDKITNRSDIRQQIRQVRQNRRNNGLRK